MIPSIKSTSLSHLSRVTKEVQGRTLFPSSGFSINTRMIPAYSIFLFPASITNQNDKSEFDRLYQDMKELNNKLILTTDRLCSSLDQMCDRLEKKMDETDKKLDTTNKKLDEGFSKLENLIQSRNQHRWGFC